MKTMFNCELEQKYQDFCGTYPESQNTQFVDYIGLNITDRQENEPVFKVYYTTQKSIINVPALLKDFDERNMINAINKIDDTVNENCVRCEIGLKNRTNSNMSFVYDWIYGRFPFVKNHKNEINKLCELKCSILNDYRYASLYFIGMILSSHNLSNSTDAKAIKLHYLLRECQDPDKIGKNFSVNNNYSLNILNGLGIYELQQVVYVVSRIFQQTNAELWMAAVDYYYDGMAKYKIYFKKFEESVYNCMIEIFCELGCTLLANEIKKYIKWITLHPELERYGIAICLDSHNIWSINFYH